MRTLSTRQTQFIKNLNLDLNALPEVYQAAANRYNAEFRGAQIGRHGIKTMLESILAPKPAVRQSGQKPNKRKTKIYRHLVRS
jgi:hypothetical protein